MNTTTHNAGHSGPTSSVRRAVHDAFDLFSDAVAEQTADAARSRNGNGGGTPAGHRPSRWTAERAVGRSAAIRRKSARIRLQPGPRRSGLRPAGRKRAATSRHPGDAHRPGLGCAGRRRVAGKGDRPDRQAVGRGPPADRTTPFAERTGRSGDHEPGARHGPAANGAEGDRRADSRRTRPAAIDSRRPANGQDGDRRRYDHQPAGTRRGLYLLQHRPAQHERRPRDRETARPATPWNTRSW